MEFIDTRLKSSIQFGDVLGLNTCRLLASRNHFKYRITFKEYFALKLRFESEI